MPGAGPPSRAGAVVAARDAPGLVGRAPITVEPGAVGRRLDDVDRVAVGEQGGHECLVLVVSDGIDPARRGARDPPRRRSETSGSAQDPEVAAAGSTASGRA